VEDDWHALGAVPAVQLHRAAAHPETPGVRLDGALARNLKKKYIYVNRIPPRIQTVRSWNLSCIFSGNTKGGSITVLLTSCLTDFESAV